MRMWSESFDKNIEKDGFKDTTKTKTAVCNFNFKSEVEPEEYIYNGKVVRLYGRRLTDEELNEYMKSREEVGF